MFTVLVYRSQMQKPNVLRVKEMRLQKCVLKKNQSIHNNALSFEIAFIGRAPFVSITFTQWRTSVKIIGGDETEPSKVAHIISRKFATEFLGNIRYFSPKTGGLQKKKVGQNRKF